MDIHAFTPVLGLGFCLLGSTIRYAFISLCACTADAVFLTEHAQRRIPRNRKVIHMVLRTLPFELEGRVTGFILHYPTGSELLHASWRDWESPPLTTNRGGPIAYNNGMAPGCQSVLKGAVRILRYTCVGGAVAFLLNIHAGPSNPGCKIPGVQSLEWPLLPHAAQIGQPRDIERE